MNLRFTNTCLLLLLLIFPGCAPQLSGIEDLRRFPQNATTYFDATTKYQLILAEENQQSLDKEFNRRFFAPWHQGAARLSADEAFWGVLSYGNRQGYAENLQPISSARWTELVVSLNQDTYPNLARPAITVRNTPLRVFPTNKPFFLDPAQAGEGYPFDYFQNSALWAGTPLLVTHSSIDGAWYFVEAGLSSGWIAALDLAWVDETFRSAYQSGRYAALLQDAVSLYDEQSNFLVQTHIGAMFPLVDQEPRGLALLVPVRDAQGWAQTRTAQVTAQTAAIKPVPLTPQYIAQLADAMAGQLYGWGGLYENRDCSAFLRDLFTPFGIWLPRNSGAQARTGQFIDLAGFSAEQKRAALLREGLPFYTLIWLRGHTALYIGTDPISGEPLLLHNLWGVPTQNRWGQEGRALVGRLAVTSLHPGEERRDVARNRFLDRVLGLTLLPGAREE